MILRVVVFIYKRGSTVLLLVFFFSRGGKIRGRKISREENFARGKFREIPLAVDVIFAGGKFRAKSKFAKIAKLNSTRKIGVIQYLHSYFCAGYVGLHHSHHLH